MKDLGAGTLVPQEYWTEVQAPKKSKILKATEFANV